jgi:Cyanobacterial TRADD-N associated 2-Transmembrane domain
MGRDPSKTDNKTTGGKADNAADAKPMDTSIPRLFDEADVKPTDAAKTEPAAAANTEPAAAANTEPAAAAKTEPAAAAKTEPAAAAKTEPAEVAKTERADVNGAKPANVGNRVWSLLTRRNGKKQRTEISDTLVDASQHIALADLNLQQIAVFQLELLTVSVRTAIKQSDRSFRWALVGSGFSLLLFGSTVWLSKTGVGWTSVIPLIAGAIFQAVSGLMLYLYGKSSSQLSAFQSRLEAFPRYMLANTICDSLSTPEDRDKARTALIGAISVAAGRYREAA